MKMMVNRQHTRLMLEKDGRCDGDACNGNREGFALVSDGTGGSGTATGRESLDNFILSWDASLYALWIGSCMVLTDVVF
jgi:hypothetical protein